MSADAVADNLARVPDATESSRQREAWFVTTHWSVIAAAGGSDSGRARAALENLCRAYWYPLYAFVRRLGHQPHDAEDLVQSFFVQCLEKNYLSAADESKGRFRSFLLTMLKRFLTNEWHRSTAQKRGGKQSLIELDALTAEQRYAVEPAESLTAEQIYERRWALTLLDNVIARLREEHIAAGRIKLFDELKQTIAAAGRNTPYAELATRLGMTEGAVKVAVHRLRERYRALLEEEIAHTVAAPADVAEERRYLLSILSR